MTTVGDLIASAAADNLSDASQEALLQILESEPERLEEFLTGADDRSVGGVTGSAEQTVEVEDIETRLESVPRTTRQLYDVVKDIPEPMTRADISKHIEENHPEFLEDHKSAKHGSWLSTHLNNLAKKGIMGKYRYKKNVLWTPDIYEAIISWFHINHPTEELTTDYATEISIDLGIPQDVVCHTIKEHH